MAVSGKVHRVGIHLLIVMIAWVIQNNNGDISIDIVQRDADQDLQPTSQLTIRFHSPLLRVRHRFLPGNRKFVVMER